MPLLDKYSGTLTAKAAEHLLRRTMFGVTRADIAMLTGKSVDYALDILLSNQPLPPPPEDPDTGYVWVRDAARPQNDARFNNIMKAWWLGLMARSPISLVEKMTLFWHNHFVSSWSAVGDSRYMYKQNALLRQHALGNFRTLVREITIDPAMLRYLNGNQNRVGSPQENYARELQELFTIGKGPEIAAGNYTTYTEQDVRAAARVLTGWVDVVQTVTSNFVLSRHDTGDKQFSAAYQNTVIRGRNTANAGMEELNELLDMIFRQPATAEHICRKFYRFFVNADISPQVEQEVIKPLAATFRQNNYEVKPVLRQLLSSVHFFDTSILGAMIKTPIDLVIGTIRQLQISIPNPETQRAFYYDFFEQQRRLLATLQMDILDLPDVAGWPAYYQEPLYYKIWINSATMPVRAEFANTVVGRIGQTNGGGWTVTNRLLGTTQRITFDSIRFLQQFPNPEDPVKVVDNLAQHFFAIDLTEQQKGELLEKVFLPNLPPYEWTMEWNDFMRTPNDVQKRNLIKTRLDNLIRYMMQIAEYQIT
ncbi:MAG: DUF1800 domain-containing protein [Bacteroidota bacterium]|nr:DUF1800 domain-containing protein [Candidatus Kapabacteria bacterium]MDW8219837.1 DUF1800 domain-containing protein [Bacteroidota bacterium]